MEIVFEKGFAIEKNVDCVINSANGFLLHDSSGAGRIRELSPALHQDNLQKYNMLLKQMSPNIVYMFTHIPKKHGWLPRLSELSSLQLLDENHGIYQRGQGVYDYLLSEHMGKQIIHAISMSYSIVGDRRKRIPATTTSLEQALDNALTIALEKGVTSIAFPLMAARPTYGIGTKGSYDVVQKVLGEYKNTSIKKVIICFDNQVTRNYLENELQRN